MVYEYLLNYRDFTNAQRLYIRTRWMAAVQYYLFVWFVPVLGLAMTVPFLFDLATGHAGDATPANAGFAATGLWIAIFLPALRWFTVRRYWKNLIPKERRGKPVTLEFTDDQVISTIPGQSEGRFFWTAIRDFAQNDRITLLFVRKKFFLIIPTEAIPPEQWAEVRSKLSPILKRTL